MPGARRTASPLQLRVTGTVAAGTPSRAGVTQAAATARAGAPSRKRQRARLLPPRRRVPLHAPGRPRGTPHLAIAPGDSRGHANSRAEAGGLRRAGGVPLKP